MRPIELTMTAFGPYSGKEVIDFGELKERNLFLITGPTGAGKTTVFDAISYALYGRASGGLRTEDTLRSHFAEKQLLTEVSLSFELKGMTYHVSRIPGQMRPKTRGDGFTEQNPKATLIIEDGDPRTVISGVSKVSAKIEEIMGINVEQFRQIMMIPQGEFRKLLTSDSQEREKVLQQLFDTYLYRRIQNELYDRAKTLGGDIKRQRIERDTLIQGIKYGDDEELKGMIEAEDKAVDSILTVTGKAIGVDENNLYATEKSLQQLDAAVQRLVEERTKAEAVNRSLEDLHSKQQKLSEQQSLQAEMTELGLHVAMGEKAYRLSGIEDNLLNRERELTSRRAALEEVSNQEVHLIKVLKEAESILAIEASDQAMRKRESLREQKDLLKGYVDKVRTLESLKVSCSQVKHDLDEVKADIEENRKQFMLTKDQLVHQQKELSDYKSSELQLHKATVLETRLTDKKQQLAEVMADLKRLVSDRQVLQKSEKDAKNAAERSEASAKAYHVGRLAFYSGQAAVLARELSAGQPCPVCGSTSHPSPAVDEMTAMTEEALEKLETQSKIDEQMTIRALQEVAVWQERCSTGDINLTRSMIKILSSENGDIKDLSMEVREQLLVLAQSSVAKEMSDCQDNINRFQREVARKDQLEKTSAEMTASLENLEKKMAFFLEEERKGATSMTELVTALGILTKEVPEQFHDSHVLEREIGDAVKGWTEAEGRLAAAEESHHKANENLIANQGAKEQLTKSVAEDEEAYEKMKRGFEKQLKETGFDRYELYQSAVRTNDQLKAMKASLDAYHQQLEGLKRLVEELTGKTKGKAMVDLTEFDQQKETLENQRQQVMNRQGFLKSRIEDNKKTLKKVGAINDRIKDREAVYQVVGQLANVAQGKNPQMMTFERYVLAAFLEDIIQAANNRFHQMTQGRYELSRSGELQRRNRQSGLELEVFDNFTGRSRHVKTLSGGESFKASLSMALGLSDVVQSYAGGVRLDTMFIDEGFGTLDQESLDSAINCLIDLQKSGRLVGIISHVQELKERIDTRLEVIATNVGSTARFVVG